MKLSPRLGGALALLALLSTPAWSDETAQLGDVDVTATRTPLIADQEVVRSSSSSPRVRTW
jgi:hypothetical protein